MKAPWFPFYTGDFLASPDVQLMAAHEVGAYLLLLANSWQTDTPGYQTTDEGRLRRICRFTVEQWADSRDLLLSKWPIAENGLRYNPRLLREAGVQVARRDRLAANGAKGGRPPHKLKDTKQEPTDNLKLSENNLEVSLEEPTGLLSQPQPQSTNVDEEREASSSAQPLEAKKEKPQEANPARDAALATTDPLDEQPLEASPLTKPVPFRLMCERNGFLGIDFELYRTQGYAAAVRSKAKPRTVTQWESWIVKYLNNQGGPSALVKPGEGIKASPDPEADRLRAVAAQAQPEKPTAAYVPYVRPPNQPTGAAEPAPAYGPTSTTRAF